MSGMSVDDDDNVEVEIVGSEIKFIVIGDIHIKENTILRNTDMVERLLNRVREAKHTQHIKFIVLLGDILDRFGTARVEAHSLATEMIVGLMDICRLYVLMGNHDMPNNSSYLNGINFFRLLHRCRGNDGSSIVTLVDRVVHDTIEDTQFTFVPYVPDGMFKDALLSNPGWEQSKIIFAHQSFVGSAGIRKTKGLDTWTKNLPLVISGHIHEYSKIVDEDEVVVWYVGTPDQTSFTAEEELKSISIFHYTPNPSLHTSRCLSEMRVDLGMPKRIHLYISYEDVMTTAIPEGTSVKVTITGTMAQNAMIKKLDIIKIWKSKGVVVEYNNILEKRNDDTYAIDDDDEEFIPRRPTRFIDGLYDEIKNDPEMMEEYNEMFGSTIY